MTYCFVGALACSCFFKSLSSWSEFKRKSDSCLFFLHTGLVNFPFSASKFRALTSLSRLEETASWKTVFHRVNRTAGDVDACVLIEILNLQCVNLCGFTSGDMCVPSFVLKSKVKVVLT